MALLINGEHVADSAILDESRLIWERLRVELPGDSEADILARARDWAIENVIERALLRQAAVAFTAGMSLPSQQSADSRETSDTSFRVDRQDGWRLATFLAHLTGNVPKPTLRDVSDFYRENQSLFMSAERVHASHIVKNVDDMVDEAAAHATLRDAEAELQTGKPFQEVAENFSDCPGDGVDLGWFQRGHMVDEFEAIVFALKPNQVSPIFRTPFGFHIVKLHARKPASLPPLREVYEQAEQMLIKQRGDEAIERFLDEARAKATIEVISKATLTSA